MDPTLDPNSPVLNTDNTDNNMNKNENSSIRTEQNQPNQNAPTTNIDLFRIPHSRMKELVTWPLKEAAALPDVQDLEPSLQAVYEAMWELKSHEMIENQFIMDNLKARLHSRQVRETSDELQNN